MAGREAVEEWCEHLLTPILDEFGFDLWDVQYVKEGGERFLRVYIDKEGGITIDDCVDVSRRLSDALDAGDMIGEAYTLEVSSPGLTRKLVRDREFARSIGRNVDVKFYRPVDGTKEITGKLTGFDKDSVTVSTDEGERSFGRDDIANVRLHADFYTG